MAGGAPTKFTQAVRRKIISAVADGVPLAFAAIYAGVTERCLTAWIAKGKRGDGSEYVRFFRDIKEAQGKSVTARIRRMAKAAKSHWQADAWWLERQYPDEFAANREAIRELQKQVELLASTVKELSVVHTQPDAEASPAAPEVTGQHPPAISSGN